jgi:hypothetical protein
MIAPLQLLDYRSEALAYERLEAEPAPEDVDIGVGLQFDIDTHFDEERGAQCIALKVGFNESEEDLPDDVIRYIAHRGRVKVTGWLSWIDEEMSSRDDARRLLLVNGLSMLYGIARVRIADLTEGEDERLLLPSVSFKPVADQFLDQEGQEDTAAEGKGGASDEED